MIKLIRKDKPIELNDEKIKELTDAYINEGKIVWDKEYIKKPLLEMSNGKCCFCETKLGEEGKSMNVEHFHPKSKYPNEVVEWDNLLPSCSRCNSNKSFHDTYADPIINPTLDDPRDYFYLQDYRYRSKNNNVLGKMTIDIIYINDSDHLVYPRFKVGEEIHKKLEDILEKLEEMSAAININIRKRNKVLGGIRDLLLLAQPEKEYSAVISSVIINDENYLQIKEILGNLDLWNINLQELEYKAKEIMLDIR